MTPIVRESQVGRLLKIFWFAFGFMMAAFVSPNGAGRRWEESVFEQRRAIFGKGWIENPAQLPWGLMVAV
jgi:hypothetical protein